MEGRAFAIAAKFYDKELFFFQGFNKEFKVFERMSPPAFSIQNRACVIGPLFLPGF